MTLKDYVPRGRYKAFAGTIGVSYSYFRRLITGHVRCSAELAVIIDRVTVGNVPAAEMRPDLFAAILSMSMDNHALCCSLPGVNL